MTHHDVISILKKDNAQAWANQCGGCSTTVAQFGSLSESNMVGLKVEGKKLSRGTADENRQAYGIFCDNCLKNEQRMKEGPTEAVFVVDGTVRRLPKVYLVEAQAPKVEPAFTGEGKPVTRSTETGKIVGSKGK